MKITIMKKILAGIDHSEILGLHKKALVEKVLDDLQLDFPNFTLQQLYHFFDIIEEVSLLKSTPRGLDLVPTATIVARAPLDSESEALGFFEIIVQNACNRKELKEYLKINNFQELRFFMGCMMDVEFFDFALQSRLFIAKEHTYKINPKFIPSCKEILNEYLENEPLLSDTIKAVFTLDIIDLRKHQNFRNQYLPMVNYRNKESILRIIPYPGIPESRDDSKALQAFYKDTLFNEFNHSCAICKIALPQMLIASHIKPFRECGHIFEAIDHNNGLLLCRNHDYLFDQGYISFDEDGKIMISDVIKRTGEYQKKFVLHDQYHLDTAWLRKSRRLFLDYHRNHIYKVDKSDYET